MSGKQVIPRAVAHRDVALAIDGYRDEAGPELAVKFVDELEVAYGFICANPAAGSPRWAHELNLPGLRSWRLKRFPWLVFYFEREDHLDVWRVLNAMRDIPAWMRE